MKKTISAVVGLALVAVLSTVLVPTGATAAAPVQSSVQARAVSTACASATAEHRAAVTARSKATKKAKKAATKLAKLKKAVKRGKDVPRTKLTKAKKTKKKTQKAAKKAKNAVAVAAKKKATACSKQAQTQQSQAHALAGVLGLLLGGLGGQNLDLGKLDLAQLTMILDLLAPGAGDKIDPAQLAMVLKVLQGLGSGDIDPATLVAQFSSLFGEQLDPSVLTALLGAMTGGGTVDPAILLGLLDALSGALGDVAPGAGALGALTDAGLLGLVGTIVDIASNGLLAQLGLGQVGDLLQGLLNGSADGLSLGELTAIQATVTGLIMSNPLDGKFDLLKNSGVLAALTGALTNGAGGLPSLNSIPVLGPLLCGLIPVLPGCQA